MICFVWCHSLFVCIKGGRDLVIIKQGNCTSATIAKHLPIDCRHSLMKLVTPWLKSELLSSGI